jgi:hypothetical protein
VRFAGVGQDVCLQEVVAFETLAARFANIRTTNFLDGMLQFFVLVLVQAAPKRFVTQEAVRPVIVAADLVAKGLLFLVEFLLAPVARELRGWKVIKF